MHYENDLLRSQHLPDGGRQVMTVTQVNRCARQILEDYFSNTLVSGEISNLSQPSSGHWYFTLKDKNAQLRCAMFRNRNLYARLKIANGMQVEAFGKLGIYEARGDYQLVVDELRPAGLGDLQQRFLELKRQLENEGLFAAERKRDIPPNPRRIAVITSPSGAVIRDILSVLKRRNPRVAIDVIASPVQGENAHHNIIEALITADLNQRYDTLILARGGGSLEDLWAFNEEALARCIADLQTPIISAIGHETDFTIADFVADLRAPTPSAAAELVAPDLSFIWQTLQSLQKRSTQLIHQRLRHENNNLQHIRKRLRNPQQTLQEQAQRLDQLELRLRTAQRNHSQRLQQRLEHMQQRLLQQHPQRQISLLYDKLQSQSHALHRQIRLQLSLQKKHLAHCAHLLNSVSPLATLHRGYAITLDDKGSAISSVTQINRGAAFEVRLQDGSIEGTVTAIKATAPDN